MNILRLFAYRHKNFFTLLAVLLPLTAFFYKEEVEDSVKKYENTLQQARDEYATQQMISAYGEASLRSEAALDLLSARVNHSLSKHPETDSAQEAYARFYLIANRSEALTLFTQLQQDKLLLNKLPHASQTSVDLNRQIDRLGAGLVAAFNRAMDSRPEEDFLFGVRTKLDESTFSKDSVSEPGGDLHQALRASEFEGVNSLPTISKQVLAEFEEQTTSEERMLFWVKVVTYSVFVVGWTIAALGKLTGAFDGSAPGA